LVIVVICLRTVAALSADLPYVVTVD